MNFDYLLRSGTVKLNFTALFDFVLSRESNKWLSIVIFFLRQVNHVEKKQTSLKAKVAHIFWCVDWNPLRVSEAPRNAVVVRGLGDWFLLPVPDRLL